MPDTASPDIYPPEYTHALIGARDARAAGELAGALAIYAHLRHLFPTAPAPWREAAATLTDAARREEADILLEAAIARFPADPDLLADYGENARRDGDLQTAINRWAVLPQDHPTKALAAALTALPRGDYDTAEALLAAATTTQPQDPIAWILRAEVAAARWDMTEAARRWDTVADRFPTLPAARTAEAQAAQARHDWTTAAAMWADLRRQSPALTEAYIRGIDALHGANRHTEAETLAIQAMDRFPNHPEPALAWARLAQERQEWPEALIRWNHVRSRFPDAAEAWTGGARCLREQGQTETAEILLRHAIARLPNAPAAWIDLAWLVLHARRLDEAIELWTTAQDQFPWLIATYVGGANALRARQRHVDAKILLRVALTRFPDSFDLQSERAWLAIDLEEEHDAVARFTTLRDSHPDNAILPLGLARALTALGQFDAAEAAYRAGLDAFPRFELLQRELDDVPAKRAAWTPRIGKPMLVRAGPLRLAVTGFHLAYQLSVLFGRMPPFRDKVKVEWINAGMDLSAVRERLPDSWLDGVDAYFEESSVGAAATKRGVRAFLPPECDIITFPTPYMQCLWPFRGRDDRLIPEPPFYHGGRYLDTDAVAAMITHEGLTDDALFDAYMEMTTAMPLDLDALLAADMARWDTAEESRDVRVAPFIAEQFRDRMLFTAPHERAAPVVLEIARQLLASPALRGICDLDSALAGLERLTTGWRAEGRATPVHPRIAAHFGLRWWSPDLRYTLGHNTFTFRDYIIRYMRWSPWLV